MKHTVRFLLLAFLIVLPGCGAARQTPGENAPPAISGEQQRHAGTSNRTIEKEAPPPMAKNLRITIGNRVFPAVLEESPTTREFAKRLPRKMMMRELNGNEKYGRLSDTLPVKDENPGQIHTGDLMLYNGDTVVLFYKDFSTTYRYTRLGHITDPGGLEEVVGDGDIPVTMDVAERK